jgi:hypothetical protein
MKRNLSPTGQKSKSKARSAVRRQTSQPQLSTPTHLLRIRRSLGAMEVTYDATKSDSTWKPPPGISDVTRHGRELRNHRRVVNGSLPIYAERFLALFNKYGITDAKDPHRWKRLAFCLAMDYVPDFMLGPRPQGRKRSPTYFALISEVEITATGDGVSIHKACELLSSRDQRPWRGWDSQTIERGYYERKRQIKGDRCRMAFYEAWTLYRNQKLPDGTGDEVWDTSARRWNAMAKPELVTKLRAGQPEFTRILHSGVLID